MIAIILARSGSKRCPGKNVMSFNHGPNLVERTIEHAKWLKPQGIVVCTDYERKCFRDKYIWKMRPRKLLGDDVISEAVVDWVLKRLARNSPSPADWDAKVGRIYAWDLESFCLLQPTSPIRSSFILEGAKELFVNRELPALVSINPNYQPNGSFYFCKTSVFRKEKTLYPKGTAFWMCSWRESMDIDYPHEFRIAEAVERSDIYPGWSD